MLLYICSLKKTLIQYNLLKILKKTTVKEYVLKSFKL